MFGRFLSIYSTILIILLLVALTLLLQLLKKILPQKKQQKNVFCVCVISSVQRFYNGSDGSWVQHFVQYVMAFEILVLTGHSWFHDKETLVIL